MYEADVESREYKNALPLGYRLHWYTIQAILGQGGFGITYLASDDNLDKMVAIKEFLPSQLAMRTDGITVHPVSDHVSATFQWGLDRFLKEARTLAKFKHRGVVDVYSVFEANNTAYMVMEYQLGASLRQAFDQQGTLDPAQMEAILLPLLSAVEHIHSAGYVHRDIKPDNIYLREDGSPVLLDFGSARQALGVETQMLTSMVSPGYAPFEQYNTNRDSEKQGPWTDIYAIGATLYRAATGIAPSDALERAKTRLCGEPDPLKSVLELAGDRYPRPFLVAIDAALNFMPEDRPQTIQAWRRMFLGEPPGAEEEPASGSAPAADTPAVARNTGLSAAVDELPADPGERQPHPAATGEIEKTVVISSLPREPVPPTPSTPPRERTNPPGPATRGTKAGDAAVATPRAPEPEPASARAHVNPVAPDPGPVARSSSARPVKAALALGAVGLAVGAGILAVNKGTFAPAAPWSESALLMALEEAPCAAVTASLQGDRVHLTGIAGAGWSPEDLLRGVQPKGALSSDIVAVDRAHCGVLEHYRQPWIANQRSGEPGSISLKNAGGTLTEGDYLELELVAPAYQSHLYVDYFMLDGNVVHMVPSTSLAGNQAPAGYQATIGDLGEWQVGPPFGQEMIVMLTTSEPLFTELRPEQEATADYLKALQAAAARIESADSARVAAAILTIDTLPR